MRPVVFFLAHALLPELMLACPVQIVVTWTARPVPHQTHSQNTTVAITLGCPQNHTNSTSSGSEGLVFHSAQCIHTSQKRHFTQLAGRDHKHIVHTTHGGNTTAPYLRKSQAWINRCGQLGGDACCGRGKCFLSPDNNG
jgi:hypothetical protein